MLQRSWLKEAAAPPGGFRNLSRLEKEPVAPGGLRAESTDGHVQGLAGGVRSWNELRL